MKLTQYQVSSPDELINLSQYLKNTGETDKLISQWRWYRDRGRKSHLDGRLFVIFHITDGKRESVLVQMAGNGHKITHASYRYNLALQYCRENLTGIEIKSK